MKLTNYLNEKRGSSQSPFFQRTFFKNQGEVKYE